MRYGKRDHQSETGDVIDKIAAALRGSHYHGSGELDDDELISRIHDLVIEYDPDLGGSLS